MAPLPAPTQIIIIGPNATLGKLLSTTKNGSATLLKKLDHHRSIAIIVPISTPKEKPYQCFFTCYP